MFTAHDARKKADIRNLLFAVIAVAVMVFAAFAVVASDSSEAEPANIGETYYYDQLSPSQKAIYDKFKLMTIEDPAAVSTFTNITTQTEIDNAWAQYQADVRKAFSAFTYDVVSFFWLDKGYSSATSYDSGSKVLTITTTVSIAPYKGETTNAQVDARNTQITAKVNDIDSRIDKSTRLTTLTGVHKEICDLLTYPDPIPSGNDVRNIATAFLDEPNHYVVCEGYAKAFKYLCDKYDIPCILVSGWGYGDAEDKASHSQSDSNRHMWNMVQMENGRWYIVDATWDDNDGSMTTKYFLKGSESTGYSTLTLGEDHEIDDSFGTRDPAVPHLLAVPTPAVKDYGAAEYTVTFYDDDGSTILSRADYYTGDVPVAPATPTKAPTNTQVFTFKCWTVGGAETDIQPVGTAAVDYVAKYDESDRHYTVTFKDSVDKGSAVIQTRNDYLYEEAIVKPADPSGSSDDYFRYTFDKWSPAVPAKVTADAEYVAQYVKVKNFTDDSGALSVKSKGNSITFNSSDISIIQASTGSLTINMPDATIVFDNTAAQALSAEETLTVNTGDFKSLSKEAREKLKNAVVYEIDFGTNNNVFTAGKATVTVKFTPASGQSTSEIKLFYVNGANVSDVPCTYANNKLTFETNHFSTYAVQIPEEKSTDIISLLMENYILLAILLFAFLGMAASYKFS